MLHLMLAREIVREIERAVEEDLRRRQLAAEARAATARNQAPQAICAPHAIGPSPSAGTAAQPGRPARANG